MRLSAKPVLLFALAILVSTNAVATAQNAITHSDQERLQITTAIFHALLIGNTKAVESSIGKSALATLPNLVKQAAIWKDHLGPDSGTEEQRITENFAVFVYEDRKDFLQGSISLNATFNNANKVATLELRRHSDSSDSALFAQTQLLLNSLSSLDFPRVASLVDSSAKTEYPEAWWKDQWASILNSNGHFRRVLSMVRSPDPDQIVSRCEFDNSDILLVFEFWPHGGLVGFVTMKAP